MQEIIYSDGKLIIKDSFNPTIGLTSSDPNKTPHTTTPGESITLSFLNLHRVETLSTLKYDTLGQTSDRYFKVDFRLSRDTENWTEWMPITGTSFEDFGGWSPASPMFLDVRWTRMGSVTTGNLRLLDYQINGTVEEDIFEGGETVKLDPNNREVILKPPFIYKVFRLDQYELIASGDVSNISILWRFTQDSGKTWTSWEVLSNENISTKRINPVNFFVPEFKITYNGNGYALVNDLNLIGDFQNVSQDYFKTNLMGIRECCASNIVNQESGDISVGSSELPSTITTPMTDEEKAKLFNPYALNPALNLYNTLSNQVVELFGHKVIYFVTDTDKKGQDHIFNEFQLHNYVCEQEIKVAVSDNNFPDNQIKMNQFDLSLFDTFEIHITKEEFKQAFGVQRRPSKEDFLYFCTLNRMYQVEHSQQFRNFNNSAVYYKVMLKKYTQKANVIAGNDEIAQTVKNLVKNSTIEELFGKEIANDKLDIANKVQETVLTKEPIRLETRAGINKELIENGVNIISKSNYDLSSVEYGGDAIIYKNIDNSLNVSDNRSFAAWFNINNYVVNESYNFMNWYDDTNNLGWKINLLGDQIDVVMNSSTYSFGLAGGTGSSADALFEGVWYAYVANIDQRNRKLTQWIYKRDCEDEADAKYIPTTILKLVYKSEVDIEPISYLIEDTTKYAKILGSDMKYTNIRVFNDVIPEDQHSKVLNQVIIGETHNLIFGDNANQRLFLPNLGLT